MMFATLWVLGPTGWINVMANKLVLVKDCSFKGKDLTGSIFNSWTVLGFAGHYIRKGALRTYKSPAWLSKCKCGNEFIRMSSDLISGKSRECKSCYSTANKLRMSEINKGKSTSLEDNPNWKGYKNIPRAFYSQTLSNARVRGIPFTLTIEDLNSLWEKQQGKCYFTGISLKFYQRLRSSKSKMYSLDNPWASLDRLDSKKEYTLDNVVFVWKAVNLTKMAFSKEDFLNLVTKVYEYSIKSKT